MLLRERGLRCQEGEGRSLCGGREKGDRQGKEDGVVCLGGEAERRRNVGADAEGLARR